jgi:phosphoglucosamine mutase
MSQAIQRIFSNGRAYIGGVVNEGLLTPENITKVGQVAGLVLSNGGHHHRVLIGKDTRLSGYEIERALGSGFLSVGMEVMETGPIPAPAIAMLTNSMNCDLGIMIGAPEEGFDRSGIEIFAPAHHVVSEDTLGQMETLFHTDLSKRLSKGVHTGKAKRIETAQGRYVQYVKGTLPSGTSFKGLRVVLDCAHGAAYKVAPEALEELEAELFPINVSPDGVNINRECGTIAPRVVKAKAQYHRADVGFAFDGSGSRLCLVDEKGTLVEHDALQAFFAGKAWQNDPLVMALQITALMQQKQCLASQVFQ